MIKIRLHPGTLIGLWAALALALQYMAEIQLTLALMVLLLTSLAYSRAQLRQLVRRTRWIVLSLLLVYAYTTPGRAIWGALGVGSPTYEGIREGWLQLERLLSVLMGLSILTKLLGREGLIEGIYALTYPLGVLGFPRTRFAVRLALSLNNMEQMMAGTKMGWREILAQVNAPAGIPQQIELKHRELRVMDYLAWLAMMWLATEWWL